MVNINLHERADAILSYWFGAGYADLGQLDSVPAEKTKFWYGGGPVVDQYIKDNFLADLENLEKGMYDDWKESTFNCMAGITLIDQFSRNMFRGDARMYAMDPVGLKWTIHMVDLGLASALPTAMRMSLCLPFMHSESLEMQQRGVAFLESELKQLEETISASGSEAPPLASTLNMSLVYAKKHEEVVAKWGRFPHRNAILGRQSTPEEVKGLEEGTIAKF